MRQAAEVALAQGRTAEAIQCFLDAAEAAVRTRDERALDHVQRALTLKRSHRLDPSVTRDIDRRLGFDPDVLHLTSLIR